MSYLNLPQLHFFGTFRADPSTLNNTPDNFNPNNGFPPANGQEVGNNIQLYWNPNGSAEFLLDCTVGRIRYSDGSTATTSAEDPLIGLSVASMQSSLLDSAKVVDLDPMQQNVTQIWGLRVAIGKNDAPLLQGSFKPSAYTNAWIQVEGGRGDYAGSASFQSVLENVELAENTSRFLTELRDNGVAPDKLSFHFVLRSFNSASQQYRVDETTLAVMAKAGVSAKAIAAITPISQLRQGRRTATKPPAGQIPTTSYFTKLVTEYLAAAKVTKSDTEVAAILKAAELPAETPLTDYDFTYGQAFGTLGLANLPASVCESSGFDPAPDFLCPDRILTPPAVHLTDPPHPVPTDTASYSAYFAPFKVTRYQIPDDGLRTYVTIDLGNSLASTKPASPADSFVDCDTYGSLALYCFDGTGSGKVIGRIAYKSHDFYSKDSGIANVLIGEADTNTVLTRPLSLVRLNENGAAHTVLLKENELGMYVRPNQFVYRVNPAAEPDPTAPDNGNPGTVTIDFYVSQFGQPAKGVRLAVNVMPPLEAQTYSNNTLGTGGTTGMVNMSVPESALILENNGITTTDENGIARLTVTGSDPGNPRGYMDGQIYFLQYGFDDPALREGYVQSPDDIVSLQVYDAQPDIENVTWENFVGPVLSQYHKIYPIMSFLDLGNKEVVASNASKIRDALLRDRENGGDMPVTRDMSASRLELVVRWLDLQIQSTT